MEDIFLTREQLSILFQAVQDKELMLLRESNIEMKNMVKKFNEAAEVEEATVKRSNQDHDERNLSERDFS